MRMARNAVGVALLLALALPVCAEPRPASIAGIVRNSAGVPQMGAAVEVFNAAFSTKVFTDDHGQYVAKGLDPGTYSVRVSATSFLPSLRENIPLASGARLMINLTLNTLFEAVQFLPAKPHGPEEEDDWKWTLRSTISRPILRLADSGAVVVSSSRDPEEDRTTAKLMFLAGSAADGFGSAPGVSTAFTVEQSLFRSGRLSFNGNVGYGEGSPAAVVRAAYSHDLGGSRPEVALTLRRFASPENALREGALEAFALSVGDTTTLGDFLEFNYGGELQMVRFQQTVGAFRPFVGVTTHLGPNTTVQYRYATSQPTTRLAKGFDTAPADLSESGPRITLAGGHPVLERASHHEVAVSRRLGKNNVQVAYFADRIRNAALVGVGEVEGQAGEFLPDVYSGTFSYNGGMLGSGGMRVLVQRKFSDDLTATVEYANGGVIDVDRTLAEWDAVRATLRNERRHAVTSKVAGRLPRAKTRWLASYKWTSGEALTPVDMFNASPGQADPYLNIFVRQPIPSSDLLPGHIEALVDVRNLLAQGYMPVLGQDGQVLYLVQTARSVRGGVAFVF